MPSPWPDETRVGVFETLAVVRGRPVALEAHWRRLCESQQTVGRARPPSSLKAAIRRAARGAPGLRVALTTTRSAPTRVEILPRASRRPPAGGVTVVTATGRAASAAALPAQVKTIERIPSILAWGEAGAGGTAPGTLAQVPLAVPPAPTSRAPFEILWCNAQGLVTEGTVSNLFLVRRGGLVTPPVWVGALPGVTRQAVCRLARRLTLSVEETPVTRHELYTAEEAFVTNSLVGVAAIRVADGRRIGARCPGPVTRRLQRAYAARLRRGAA
ncbi:MAG: hypothetical protein A3C53_08415 [Omnitrophica WOR_2 bacterium RIFCSPHIGHO2_02_FULL_68_15]|nr:MAG: hypothetical protein A3C53_08415 [Omnitrophica WOR_2 bacterium RIFCSPHIGHO2_02_FULL_68_15]